MKIIANNKYPTDFQAREVAGVKIFAFEAPIYYANRNYFLDQLYHKTQCNPKKIKRNMDKAAKKTNGADNVSHSIINQFTST